MPDLTAPTTRMVPVPWDEHADQDAACPVEGCDHPYHRHFDSYGSWDDDGEGESHPAVGCKYCECDAFANQYVPQPPRAGTVGHMLTVIDPHGPISTVHATEAGAMRFLAQTVTETWPRVMGDVPVPEDLSAVVRTFYGAQGPVHAFRLEQVTIQS